MRPVTAAPATVRTDAHAHAEGPAWISWPRPRAGSRPRNARHRHRARSRGETVARTCEPDDAAVIPRQPQAMGPCDTLTSLKDVVPFPHQPPERPGGPTASVLPLAPDRQPAQPRRPGPCCPLRGLPAPPRSLGVPLRFAPVGWPTNGGSSGAPADDPPVQLEA